MAKQEKRRMFPNTAVAICFNMSAEEVRGFRAQLTDEEFINFARQAAAELDADIRLK